MKKILFEQLLAKRECQILDFKREFYDLNGVNKIEREEKIAKFLKDLISFANTIRTESAYIIIGIAENNSGDLVANKIKQHPDDAVLQSKIKDKVHPIPQFLYYPYNYENMQFGIIEIPIVKYPEPCKPTKNLRGLEKGKVYLRRGSMNDEAKEHEIVMIYDWLRSLTMAEEYVEYSKVIPSLTIKDFREILFMGIFWALFSFVKESLPLFPKLIISLFLFVWGMHFFFRFIDTHLIDTKYRKDYGFRNNPKLYALLGIFIIDTYFFSFLYINGVYKNGYDISFGWVMLTVVIILFSLLGSMVITENGPETEE